jgi:hypothetical protein
MSFWRVLLTGIDNQLIERINLPLPICRAMLKRLVDGFPPRRPGFDITSDHVGFVVYKMELGQSPPSTSIFPVNSRSTDWSIIMYRPGLVQWHTNGLRKKCTQLQSIPRTRKYSRITLQLYRYDVIADDCCLSHLIMLFPLQDVSIKLNTDVTFLSS